MHILTPRRLRFAGLVLAVAPAFALSACGTTEIDPSKAAALIRKDLATGVTAKSIKCPGGIKAKKGTSFNCTVRLARAGDNTVHTGTVTVHITNSSGHAEVKASDFHVQ
jgi:hypothetical protein